MARIISSKPCQGVNFPDILVVLLMCLTFVSSSFIVDAPAGRFEGLELTAPNGKAYVGFRGIPYAEPPVGQLRFSKPVPHPRIEGTFNATPEPVWCPQLLPVPVPLFPINVQEDCLVLHVYGKPTLNQHHDKRKVLVFSHGGALVYGSAATCLVGNFVTEQDIIVVAINYRLGILGFLSTENQVSPGNYGLWDQALAVQWVKDNIASFGGDPGDITFAGESSGASSVAFLSISPITKGLFTKVFTMSGAATSMFGNAVNPQLHALVFAKSVNCWDGEVDHKVGIEQSEDIIKCLRELPLSNFTNYLAFNFAVPQFVPTADGEFLPKSPFKLITDREYLESVNFYQRSYLIGLDNNEKSFVQLWEVPVQSMEDIPEARKSETVSDMLNMSKALVLQSRFGVDPSQILIDKVMNWYDRRFGKDSLIELMSDNLFLIPTFDLADALGDKQQSQAYLLYFDHYPNFMKGDIKGTAHGVDLLYWQDHGVEAMKSVLEGVTGDMDLEDTELKSAFSAIISDFVKTGDPGKTLKTKMPKCWPRYNARCSLYLNFEPKPSVRSCLEEDKRRLWKETIPGWISELQSGTPHTEP